MHKLLKYPWPGNVRELQHMIEKAVILSDSGTFKPDDFIFKSGVRMAASSLLTLEEMERQMIEAALDRFNGKHTDVANQLGISRQTLYNKIKLYDL